MISASIRRRFSWTMLLSLTLIVLAFAFAACGGDSSSSNTSSSSTPAMTVNVKETKAQGQDDVYTCDPTSIIVKTGDSVRFTNMSDENQDFDQGDAAKAGVDFVIGLNQSQTVTFKTAGTFMLKSEKGATITVTVQ